MIDDSSFHGKFYAQVAPSYNGIRQLDIGASMMISKPPKITIFENSEFDSTLR
jgi:hypothetical protein